MIHLTTGFKNYSKSLVHFRKVDIFLMTSKKDSFRRLKKANANGIICEQPGFFLAVCRRPESTIYKN